LSLTKKRVLTAGAILLIALIFVVLYEDTQPKVAEDKDSHVLYQLSAFNVFSAGNYDGNTSFAELATHGNFGIGTLNGLNGEMIALNGKFYQIPTNGTPRQIEPSEKTPYATVTFLQANQAFEVDNASTYAQLTTAINATLPDFNTIYAIKVHGYFESAQTRSVPIQSKPYPALTEAIKNQNIYIFLP
jgi:acetolactate decarboxylase